ncbi:MAG: RHS repeat-associated core domain-containing protein [Patescibacteria group bacterium]
MRQSQNPFILSHLSHFGGASVVQATFTGQEYDEENALQYYGARYMDNETARFASIDPIIIKVDSVSKVLSDPQALNSYAYSRNNPIILVDKDGNFYVPFLSNYINKVVGGAIGRWIVNNPKQSAEIGLGFVPVAGEANDLTETIRGRETITGKELSTNERLVTGGATLLPFVGGKVAREMLNKSDEIVTLYHGTGHFFTDIGNEGFKNGKLWLTNSSALAEHYSDNWLGENLDKGVVRVMLPKSIYERFIKNGSLIIDNKNIDSDKFWSGLNINELKTTSEEVINTINKYIQ